MMISSAVLASFIFAAVAELALPIVLLVVLCLKKKVTVIPMFLGFAAFLVSQVWVRIPILNILSTQSWFKAFALNTIPYVVMLSVTAGLFEESARLLCAGCFLKKHRMFRDALSFGLGHGFCEVILITGLTQINNIIYTVMINSGTFRAATASLPAAQSQAILSAMQAVAPTAVYLGVLERVFAVTFHIFASILIFKGVNEHKFRFYLYAIAAHSVFNLGAVLLAKYAGIWASEGFLFVASAGALVLIFKMKPSFPQANAEVTAPVPSVQP